MDEKLKNNFYATKNKAMEKYYEYKDQINDKIADFKKTKSYKEMNKLYDDLGSYISKQQDELMKKLKEKKGQMNETIEEKIRDLKNYYDEEVEVLRNQLNENIDDDRRKEINGKLDKAHDKFLSIYEGLLENINKAKNSEEYQKARKEIKNIYMQKKSDYKNYMDSLGNDEDSKNIKKELSGKIETADKKIQEKSD